MDKRGPKIGDAASLWNFTPAPGWSESDLEALKLCVMAYGVGAWGQIAATQLLPGKTTQQLSSQTQRLLGQQSLAAFTGLRVHVDRVRADNESRTDAQRKAGLIIRSGPNPTREMRAAWQAEAREKYGLSDSEVATVEAQLAELMAQRGLSTAGAASSSKAPGTIGTDSGAGPSSGGGEAGTAGSSGQAGSAAAGEVMGAQLPSGIDIMSTDAAVLPRGHQAELLCRLHERLGWLVTRLLRQDPQLAAAVGVSHVCQQQQEQSQQQQQRPEHVSDEFEAAAAAAAAATEGWAPPPWPWPRSAAGEEDAAAAAVAEQSGAAVAKGRKAGSRKPAGVRKPPAGPRRGSASPPKPKKGAAGQRAPKAPRGVDPAAFAAAIAADVAELVSMGFPEAMAREALEETGYCGANAAANWLAVHCL